MSLHVSQFAVGGFDSNLSYVITDTATRHAAVVDPAGDLTTLITHCSSNDLEVVAILLTHTHFDHYDALSAAIDAFGVVPICVYEDGESRLEAYSPLHKLTNHETVMIGDQPITVLHTPGHSNDSACFCISRKHSATEVPLCLTGDTLFINGCGRTDRQHVRDLYQSLQNLLSLPDETIIYPGHDYGPQPTDTLGNQKQTNPYLLAQNFEQFTQRRLG